MTPASQIASLPICIQREISFSIPWPSVALNTAEISRTAIVVILPTYYQMRSHVQYRGTILSFQALIEKGQLTGISRLEVCASVVNNHY